jgi:PmbA protein
MSSVDIQQLIADGIEWIRKEDSTAQAELYASRTHDRGIDLKEGRPELAQETREEGLGLRLLKDGRLSFAYSGGFDKESVSKLYRRALEQLPHLEPDVHRVLPAPGTAPAVTEELRKSINDSSLFDRPLADFVPQLTELNARAKGKDPRISKVLVLGYGENLEESAIANTAGVLTHEFETYAHFGLSLVAEADGEVQVGGASRLARYGKEIDHARTVDEGVFRTVSLLKARKEAPRKCSVLFDPWVAGDLLELISGALTAEAVQRGKSLFKDKLEKRVAASCVTFVDDPLMMGGISSGPFDDEGVATQTKIMIDKGVLKNYFYDAYTANKGGVISNGCGGRSGFKGAPGATSSNFFMQAGDRSREQLLSETKDGILVFEIMGMHTADAISGEMSVGVSGVAIKDGKISHGVRGAMLSCSIFQLLEQVDAVADDLTFYGGLATPTFRVAGLTIA